MTASEEIRIIKADFDRIISAVGKAKQPIISSLEGTVSGRALRLLLDPQTVLHIDKKSLRKQVNLLPSATYRNLFELCDHLKLIPAASNQEIADVQFFVSSLDAELQPFTRAFITKSIRLGVTVKTLNKCFKIDSVSCIACMLANKYFEHADVVTGQAFAITEKLDGIRCLAVVRHGEKPVLYSRQGKVITGLSEIESELSEIAVRHNYEYVLDGELLIRNRDGYPSKEQYKRTMKIVSSDAAHKTGITFNAFDCISPDAFYTKTCTTPYYLRRQKLDVLLERTNFVKPVPILYSGKDIGKIKELVDYQRGIGHEGVMINLLLAPYEFKRSNNLLKVKVMQDADLKIIGFTEGEGRFEGMLGALVVDYKGTPVGVGSGLMQSDRVHIWNNQDLYLGRVAKIRYFEETVDTNGIPSLRFPVFEEIREEGKEVSYN